MGDFFERRIAADRAHLHELEEAVRDWTARLGLNERAAVHIDLVVEELVTNVVFHGRHTREPAWVEVRVERIDDVLCIRVTDNMAPFDPFSMPPPDLSLDIEARPIGGLGIHFVRTLMDTWHYERAGNFNVVTLHKQLTHPRVTH